MKEEKIYNYIYKTTNTLNGKYYYGMHSTNNLEDGYIGSGTRLKRSIKKHGIENFNIEILHYFPDRESLVQKEIEIVNEDLLKDPKCINLMRGGSGGTYSEEHLKKAFDIGREKAHFLMKNCEVYKKKFSESCSRGLKRRHANGKFIGKYPSFIGKTHTEETKRKIGKANSFHQSGKNNSQYGTCWITNGLINKKITKESINDFPNWKLGRTFKKFGKHKNIKSSGG